MLMLVIHSFDPFLLFFSFFHFFNISQKCNYPYTRKVVIRLSGFEISDMSTGMMIVD